jgi:hypothetical protein
LLDEKHQLMASTIAGFLTQTRALRGSDFWNNHWTTLTTKIDDPYVRAILMKIGGDNIESVLDEEAIPLLDRVAIAMFHLHDKPVSSGTSPSLIRVALADGLVDYIPPRPLPPLSSSCLAPWSTSHGTHVPRHPTAPSFSRSYLGHSDCLALVMLHTPITAQSEGQERGGTLGRGVSRYAR